MSFPINVTKQLTPIYSGDDWIFSCVFKRPNETNNINLVSEGWSNWKAQWRPFTKSEDYFDLVVDTSYANVGRIIVKIPSSITSQIDKNGVFDLEAKQGTLVRTWVKGDIHFEKDVTR